MIPIMEHAYSPSPTPSRGNEKVLISIDDTALLHGDSPRNVEGGPTLRGHSKSLNRLDHMEEDIDHGEAIFKCPSYPRLLGSRDRIVNADPSITHVDTDSISPRVSTDNLSYHDRERPTLGGGLVRSVSARTVDSLPPLELRTGQPDVKGTTGNFLSPGENSGSLVSRSTSCPSMAYRRSPCPSPTSHHSPRPIGRTSCPPGSGMQGSGTAQGGRPQRVSVHEINLEGEVIKDLPIEPRQSFPDFIPEEPAAAAKCQVEEHPMHTRRLKDVTLDREKFRINGDHKPRINVKETQKSNARLRQGYFNIGDIPSTLAQKVISEHNTYKPEVDDRVQAKCLQWLNSLDHD